MFAVIKDKISQTPQRDFHSEEIDVVVKEGNDSLVIANYSYESSPQFGSSVESQGYLVFDKTTDLVAVTTQYDTPKPTSIFSSLEDALEVEFRMPNLKPEDEHQIYKEYGYDSINGYTISFKENSKSFDVTQNRGLTLDPEDEAEERAKFSGKRISDEMVNDIARKAMSDGMYIWSCDLYIENYSISYSDPLVFIGVSEEFLEDLGFEKLFEISRSAIR
jgi:hypothetical protein